MIGFCEGVALSASDLLTSGGVGYRIRGVDDFVTGETYRLWVSTVVRDTAITLYGFASCDERSVFEALCGVQSVGPAAALNVLRSVTVAELAAAVETSDAAAVKRARGVGAATAQRIVAELKMPTLTDPESRPQHGPAGEVIGALTAMGFAHVDVVAAVRELDDGAADIDALLSATLHKLSAGVN